MARSDHRDGGAPIGGLSIGLVLRETWNTYRSRLFFLFVFGFGVFALLKTVLIAIVADLFSPNGGRWIGSALEAILLVCAAALVAASLLTGVIVLAGYHARVGRRVGLLATLGAALRKTPLLIALNLAVAVIVIAPMLGALWLLSPTLAGLFAGPLELQARVIVGLGVVALFAPWAAAAPAALIEGRGFGALARSLSLTRRAPWSLRALLALWVAVAWALEAGAEHLFLELVSGPHSIPSAVLRSAALYSVAIGVLLVGLAVVYVHLRRLEAADPSGAPRAPL